MIAPGKLRLGGGLGVEAPLFFLPFLRTGEGFVLVPAGSPAVEEAEDDEVVGPSSVNLRFKGLPIGGVALACPFPFEPPPSELALRLAAMELDAPTLPAREPPDTDPARL